MAEDVKSEEGFFLIAQCGLCGRKKRLYFEGNMVSWFQDFASKHRRCERWMRSYSSSMTDEEKLKLLRVAPGSEYED